MGQFYLLSWLQPLFTGFSKCPPVRLSCQASIERQMLPPLPTPLTGPLLWMLHAQGSWEVKVSFHLILLGKAIVAREGFRTEVPNCPKMGKQIHRADSQAVGVTGHCHRVSSLFFGNQYFFFFPNCPWLDRSWDMTDLGSVSSSVKRRELWWPSRSPLSWLCCVCAHRTMGSRVGLWESCGQCHHASFWRDESTGFLYSQGPPSRKERERKKRRRKMHDVLFSKGKFGCQRQSRNTWLMPLEINMEGLQLLSQVLILLRHSFHRMVWWLAEGTFCCSILQISTCHCLWPAWTS